MHVKLVSSAFLWVLILTAHHQARADYVLNISDGVNFAPSVVNVNAGSTVTISFLATQTDGANFFDSPTTGLVAGDFDATVSGSDITPVSFSINSLFTDVGGTEPTAISGQEVRFNIFEITGTGAPGITVANDIGGLDPGGDSVVLGTATFNVSASAVGSHVVTIVPNKDGFGNDLFLRADTGSIPLQLEFNDPTTFTFNVTAVPEPSSFGALLLIGGALTLRRRRRR